MLPANKFQIGLMTISKNVANIFIPENGIKNIFAFMRLITTVKIAIINSLSGWI